MPDLPFSAASSDFRHCRHGRYGKLPDLLFLHAFVVPIHRSIRCRCFHSACTKQHQRSYDDFHPFQLLKYWRKCDPDLRLWHGRRRRGNFYPGFPYFLCDRRDLAAEKPCRTDLCTQLLFYPSGLVFDQTRFIHRHSIRN